MKISAFDFEGVCLHASRWNDQYVHAREFYLNVSNDDILQGFRAKAGLPAPGKPLGGWCDEDSSTVFGQWLSGMSRMYRATGDHAMRDKAAYLLDQFSKTVGPDGNCRMDVYPYEKLVCGLVDMYHYAGDSTAMPLLERVTAYAARRSTARANLLRRSLGDALREAARMVYTAGKPLSRLSTLRQQRFKIR